MKLTIYRWSWLVATKVLRRSRRRIEAWWTLGPEVRWHTLRLLGLLWRGSQTRPALGCTASHYSTKQVAGSMTDLGRLGLRWTAVLARATAGF